MQVNVSETYLRQRGLKIPRIGCQNEVERFASPETLNLYHDFESKAAEHNRGVERWQKQIALALTGNSEPDAVAAARLLIADRLNLSTDLVQLVEQKNALWPILRKDFADWKMVAKKAYEAAIKNARQVAIGIFPKDAKLREQATAELADKHLRDYTWSPNLFQPMLSAMQRPEIEIELAKRLRGLAILRAAGLIEWIEWPVQIEIPD